MITPVLLAILGVILLLVLVQMFRSPSGGRRQLPAEPQPPALPQTPAADLWNARAGDVVSISGGAEDYSDLDFTIDRRSAYESSNRRWIDLSGEFRGHRVYLEVADGGKDLMGILDPRKLTLADIAATEDQMADFDTRQDPSAFLLFEGKRWHYESSREIGYFENEQGEGEGLYRWIFREPDAPRLLCIEKWAGEPFDVRVARRLSPQDVTVYRAS